MFEFLTNPNRKQIEDLKKQVLDLSVRAEKAEHTSQLALQESWLGPGPQPFGAVVPPIGQLFGANVGIPPLFGARYDNRLYGYFYLTEAILDWIRWIARSLYQFNPTAFGVVRGIENYIIGPGYQYQVVPSPRHRVSDALVKSAQYIVDDFLNKNRFWELEQEAFERSVREGEYFFRLFPQEDGITELVVEEPEWVRQPSAEPEWWFGVKVQPEHHQRVLGYNVTETGVASDGTFVPVDRMVHGKINVDRAIRRGLSCFIATQEPLVGIMQLLSAGVQGESVRQAIAYIQQFAQANQQTVQSMSQTAEDFFTRIPTQAGSRPIPTQEVVPGSVPAIPQGLEFKNGPIGNAENADMMVQAAAKQIAVYFQAPQWMVSGDSGTTSFAGSLTAESPFIRNCQREQKRYSEWNKQLLMRVLSIAELQGMLPEGASQKLLISVECPPLLVRNPLEETKRHALLFNRGIIGRRTWTTLEDMDFDEQQEIKRADGDPEVPLIQPNIRDAQSTTPEAEYARQTEPSKE